MAFFALIPVLGAWVVWLPVALYLALTGAITKALVLTAIGAGLVGMADNVLRPVLLSGRSSMNGLVTFVALLGGVAAFGFIGLVFGPVVVAVGTALLDAYLAPIGVKPVRAEATVLTSFPRSASFTDRQLRRHVAVTPQPLASR